jgi:DNA-binding Lrp family transcriptional regulator
MSELQFHPLADLFPLMEGEDFDALVTDIAANGLREKIDLYQGKIVEGRNRYLALQRLGIDPSAEPSKYFRKAIYAHTVGGEIDPHEQNNDDRVRAYVISKNIHRRHLTAEQKRDLVAKLLKATPEKSNRQIAKAVGVSHPHVAKVREELEASGDVETVTTSIDTKGRKQPAKKANVVHARVLPQSSTPIPVHFSLVDSEASAAARKAHYAKTEDDGAMPTEEEAEESYQETLFDQACLILEQMTGETRQKFFAHLRGKYLNALGKPISPSYDPKWKRRTPLTSINRLCAPWKVSLTAREAEAKRKAEEAEARADAHVKDFRSLEDADEHVLDYYNALEEALEHGAVAPTPAATDAAGAA